MRRLPRSPRSELVPLACRDRFLPTRHADDQDRRTMTNTLNWDEQVGELVEALRRFRAPNVFNQWDETDPDFDCDGAPAIRRNNLREYLRARPRPRYVFIGEAPSWQGTRFSGIPMTSERILLRKHPSLRSIEVIPGARGRRTSRTDVDYRCRYKMADGFPERSATRVWETIRDRHLGATDFVLWNAMPWHPHKNGTALSNRDSGKFTCEEMEAGRRFLCRVLHELYPSAHSIALGSYGARELLKAEGRAVPHPAERRGNFRGELSHMLSSDAARHSEDAITSAMNRVCESAGDHRDDFAETAARRVLARVEWR